MIINPTNLLSFTKFKEVNDSLYIFSLGICVPKDQTYALSVDTDISQFDKGKTLQTLIQSIFYCILKLQSTAIS